MTYESLYNKSVSIFKERGIEFNHNTVGLACQYFYRNLTRVEVYTELKKFVRNSTLISDILNIYDCLKDVNKPSFPKFISHVSVLREALAEL